MDSEGAGISPSTKAAMICRAQSFDLEPQAQVVNVDVSECRMWVIWARRWVIWCGLLLRRDLVSTNY